MTSPLCASNCTCMFAHSPIGINTTVTVSNNLYGFSPMHPLAVTIVAHAPFAPSFSPPAHTPGCAQVTPSSPWPAFGHPTTQVHRSRDLIQEWADERMVADLKYWADVFEAAKPELSADLLKLHEQWKSLSTSARAVAQEKLEENKKNWLMAAKLV